jgi:eukaryotic-like serine/threonine-protein kinase
VKSIARVIRACGVTWRSRSFSAGRGYTAGTTLFIAPFRGKSEIPAAEWRTISESADTFVAAAGWSPDGSLVYFMSETDGSRCLWAQRLDDATKRPLGPPFEVQPFHQPQVRLAAQWQPGAAGTAITRDRMIFTWVTTGGNIWMAEVK